MCKKKNQINLTCHQITRALICAKCDLPEKQKEHCYPIWFELKQASIIGAADIVTECIIEEPRSY